MLHCKPTALEFLFIPDSVTKVQYCKLNFMIVINIIYEIAYLMILISLSRLILLFILSLIDSLLLAARRFYFNQQNGGYICDECHKKCFKNLQKTFHNHEDRPIPLCSYY